MFQTALRLIASFAVGALVAGCGGGGGSGGGAAEAVGGDDVSRTALIAQRLAPFITIVSTGQSGTTVLFDGSTMRRSGIRSQTQTQSQTQAITIVTAASGSAFASASSSQSGTVSISTSSSGGVTVVSISIASQQQSQSSTGVPGEEGETGGTQTAEESPEVSEPVGIAVGFDESSAAEDGLSPDEIAEGREAAEETADVLLEPPASDPESDVLLSGFIPQATIRRHGNARFVSAKRARWFETFEDPQDNASRTPVGDTWRRVGDVGAFLRGQGYGVVDPYATTSYGLDFAKFKRHNGVPMQRGVASLVDDAYRLEAAIVRRGSRYSYYLQDNEPNPEVLRYAPWPAWWWGQYAWWWHRTHPHR